MSVFAQGYENPAKVRFFADTHKSKYAKLMRGVYFVLHSCCIFKKDCTFAKYTATNWVVNLIIRKQILLQL